MPLLVGEPLAIPGQPTGQPAGSLITRDGQLEWRGLLLGDGTPYLWEDGDDTLSGWHEMPPVDSATTERPSRHGAWAGRLLSQRRTITFEFLILVDDAADTEQAVQDLEAATALTDQVDELAVRTQGRVLRSRARITRRHVPLGIRHPRGVIRGCAIQWEAADPRRYDLVQRSLTIPPPAAGGGLTYPLTYPLDYGAPSTGGAGQAINLGTAPADVVLTVDGPMEGPLIVNRTTGAQVEFDIVLAAGDRLTIDTLAGTVVLNGSASRLHTATAASGPVAGWLLAPGANDIALRVVSSGPGAGLDLVWTDAYW